MWGLVFLTLAFLGIGFAGFLVARAGQGTTQKSWLVGAAMAGVLISGGVYFATGHPALPDSPFRERVAKVQLQLRAGDLSGISNEAMMAMLQDSLRLNPTDPRPHAFYGRLLMSEGRYDEALRAFFGALRRDPKFADALAGVGQCLLAINGAPTAEAISALEQAVAAMPANEPRRARIEMMVQALKPMLANGSAPNAQTIPQGRTPEADR